MLQRIQTVYLTLAFGLLVLAVAMIVFIHRLPETVASICFSASALLALTAIFIYRKRMRQIKIVVLSQVVILLGCVAIVFVPIIQHTPSNGIGINLCPAIIAFFFEMLARRSIIKDEKLVRSADRIR